ncbi:unnamed protein product [Prorocentrum cordatum]|uniref:Uncharacterized protein n=1 Tax=Prorocentrum cordatum TaxID=2364126 RepID=A0ABN9WZR5_9DINO|nr:unnamed protein product [Polarella glacialis]
MVALGIVALVLEPLQILVELTPCLVVTTVFSRSYRACRPGLWLVQALLIIFLDFCMEIGIDFFFRRFFDFLLLRVLSLLAISLTIIVTLQHVRARPRSVPLVSTPRS